MLQILIADDELEEREGIEFLIHEYQYPLEVAKAENGRAALAYLTGHPVDILFTDVRMPFLDGLQLSAEALKLNPELRIILFSGFSEFEYARSAISLGVSEYLLKPVSLDDFQHVMNKVVNEITARQEEKQSRKQSLFYAREHILFSLLNGTPKEQIAFSPLSLDFTEEYQKMMLLEFGRDFFENAGPFFQSDLAALVEQPMDYVNLNSYQSVLLFSRDWKPQKAYDSFYDLALLLHNSIFSKYGRHCFFAISGTVEGSKSFPSCLEQMEQLMEARFFLSDTYVFEPEDESSVSLPHTENDDHLIENIRADLQQRDYFCLREDLFYLFNKYNQKASFSHLYVKFIFSNLWKEMMQHVSSPPLQINEGVEKIYRSGSMAEVREVMEQAVALLESSSPLPAHTPNRDVAAVIQYIEAHYDSPLDLETLASKVYLSPRYLSVIFKKETGCGLNRYIKNCRMEKARELLVNTHIKIGQVCQAVGYNNVSYFCQNFREYYGKTPDRYREEEGTP